MKLFAHLGEITPPGWNIVDWALGFREEGCKLAMFWLFFCRRSARAVALEQQLFGMTPIALAFAVGATPQLVPAHVSSLMTAAICGEQLLMGVPTHSWLSLSCACLLLLGRRNRWWLLGLPVMALAHSYFDFGYKGAEATTRDAIGAAEIGGLGVCAMVLMRRIAGPGAGSTWRAVGVGSTLLAIPLALAMQIFPPTRALTITPLTAILCLATPWFLMSVDLLWRGFHAPRRQEKASRV